MIMRLFTAIAFESKTKEQISALYEELESAGVTGNFTPVSNLHLTLKFLGEVDRSDIRRITAALDTASAAVSSFELKADKCGFFTSRGEKTVWFGMNGEQLSKLAGAVDEEFSKIGFDPEKRQFTPHITLIRRAVCDSAAISRIVVPEITVNVSSSTLFESRRDGGRLLYKPIHSASLK